MAEKTTGIATRQQNGIGRREAERFGNSYRVFDQFADEMDRIFDDFGFGRGWMAPRGRSAATRNSGIWAPQIEVQQRDNELVVRADLPGMKNDDISVEVCDDAIAISGERHQESSGENEGIYRSERAYGSFYRTVPLPDGAITDQAKASFRDGVLEITMPAPPHSTRSRRLEIQQSQASHKTQESKK
ncbi:MAG TPA: Hsp20/alpha crystallin family protein [Vicinamibacterales bacterium]|jgi:HSP20 family protein